MAGGEGDAEDRTEAATPRRLEKAREEGQVAVSREVSSFGALLGGVLGLMIALPSMGLEMLKGMRSVMERSPRAERIAGYGQSRVACCARSRGGGASWRIGGAIGATFAQTRMLVSSKALMPSLAKINPMKSLKRIFGLDGLIELIKALLKLGMVGAALWSAVGSKADLRSFLLPAGRVVSARGAWALDWRLRRSWPSPSSHVWTICGSTSGICASFE